VIRSISRAQVRDEITTREEIKVHEGITICDETTARDEITVDEIITIRVEITARDETPIRDETTINDEITARDEMKVHGETTVDDTSRRLHTLKSLRLMRRGMPTIQESKNTWHRCAAYLTEWTPRTVVKSKRDDLTRKVRVP